MGLQGDYKSTLADCHSVLMMFSDVLKDFGSVSEVLKVRSFKLIWN